MKVSTPNAYDAFIWFVRLLAAIPSVYAICISAFINIPVFVITVILALIKNIFVFRLTLFGEKMKETTTVYVEEKEDIK